MRINLGKNFESLPKILEYYEEEYERFEEEKGLNGKTMKDICKNNPSFYGYYEERTIELKHLLDYMEMRVDEVTGKLYQGYKKTSNIALGEREILQYIRSDAEFIAVNIKMLEIKEIHGKFNAAVTHFKNIGYSMNNLTKLLIASMDDHIL